MNSEADNTEAAVEIGEGVGRSFEEQLILSIIDAYPEAEAVTPSNQAALKLALRREERLRSAMSALFGAEPSAGRPGRYDDNALRWMGQQSVNDIARSKMRLRLHSKEPPKPVRSDRQLAREAADSYPPEDRQNTVGRLRRKFGEQKRYWQDIALHHDDVPEALENNALIRIAGILGPRGVKMKLRVAAYDPPE